MTQTYPCAGCGANVEFVPGTTLLRCPYCDREQPIVPVQRSIAEHDLVASPAPSVAQVFTCGECGAQTQSEGLAQRCPFCGSPTVVDASALGQVAPEAVLPFAISRADVGETLRRWVSTRRFAPSALKQVSTTESLQGVYLPYWTFDTQTASQYSGRRGDYYWVTQTSTTTVNGRTQTTTHQVRHTRWRSASGNVARAFDDVLVPGGHRVEAEHLDELGSWPLGQAVAFQSEYLAGYQALRYEVEPEPAFEQAKVVMAETIEHDCREDIGGDVQEVSEVDTAYEQVTHKLVLFPMWIACYVYAGKRWPVYVNAHTGTMTGERPYSKAKIAAAVLVAVIVVVLVILAIAKSQG